MTHIFQHFRLGKNCCYDLKPMDFLTFVLSPVYHSRRSTFDDFEDVVAGHEDEEEEDDGSKKWHQKLLKSASGVLLPRRGDASSIGGQESPLQCVIANDQRRGGEAEEQEDSCCGDPDETVSLTSVSSPLTNSHQPNQASLTNVTNSLILAMTLILIMHAMIANL